MLEWLIQMDEDLFRLLNGMWQHATLDSIMPFWRQKYLWVPLYIFLFSFLLINFKKQGLLIIILAVLSVALGDTLSSKVIKPTVERLRPCRHPATADHTHLLVHCGGGYSFPSSHATNHFALATFLVFVLGGRFPWLRFPLWLWAISIAYAQVYVGVHYPLDILAGSILGTLVGGILGLICENRMYFIEENWRWT